MRRLPVAKALALAFLCWLISQNDLLRAIDASLLQIYGRMSTLHATSSSPGVIILAIDDASARDPAIYSKILAAEQLRDANLIVCVDPLPLSAVSELAPLHDRVIWGRTQAQIEPSLQKQPSVPHTELSWGLIIPEQVAGRVRYDIPGSISLETERVPTLEWMVATRLGLRQPMTDRFLQQPTLESAAKVISAQSIVTHQFPKELLDQQVILMGRVASLDDVGLSPLQRKAHEIQSLRQRPVVLISELASFAILASVSTILSLFWYNRSPRQIVYGLLVGLVAALIASFVCYDLFARWLPIGALLISITLCSLAELYRSAQFVSKSLSRIRMEVQHFHQSALRTTLRTSDDPWPNLMAFLKQAFGDRPMLLLAGGKRSVTLAQHAVIPHEIASRLEFAFNDPRLVRAREHRRPVRTDDAPLIGNEASPLASHEIVVALRYGGKLFGYWIIQSVADERITSVDEARINQFAHELGRLLYFHHNSVREQQHARSVMQQILETFITLDRQLDYRRHFLAEQSAPCLAFNLFDQVIEVNDAMRFLLAQERLDTNQLTLVKFIEHLTGSRLARQIIQQQIYLRRPFRAGCTLRDERYILSVKAISARDDGFTKLTPFSIDSILCELLPIGNPFEINEPADDSRQIDLSGHDVITEPSSHLVLAGVQSYDCIELPEVHQHLQSQDDDWQEITDTPIELSLSDRLMPTELEAIIAQAIDQIEKPRSESAQTIHFHPRGELVFVNAVPTQLRQVLESLIVAQREQSNSMVTIRIHIDPIYATVLLRSNPLASEIDQSNEKLTQEHHAHLIERAQATIAPWGGKILARIDGESDEPVTDLLLPRFVLARDSSKSRSTEQVTGMAARDPKSPSRKRKRGEADKSLPKGNTEYGTVN